MAITNCRVDPKIIEKEIARFLGGKAGRRVVLVDQKFETAQEGVEIVDIRSTPIAALHSIPPPHVLYAVDQDDLGLPFVNYLIEHNIKFYACSESGAAHYVHKDVHARSTIESEHEFQTAPDFAKFDGGYADFENICQALSTTRDVDGAYVEVGCFRGSSGGIALRYMQEAGIHRSTYFLDVFDGFTYAEAEAAPTPFGRVPT